MFAENLAYGLLAALAIALAYTIATDIKYRLIYNKVVIAIAIGAPIFWIATGQMPWPDMVVHLIAATLVFLLFSLFFYLGVMGGGDVKLFTVLALWFEWSLVTRMMLIATVLGLFVTLVFWAEHRFAEREGKARIPYGVAIALAGLWACSERYFNQFG